MSTLVSIVMAVVMNLLSIGSPHTEIAGLSKIEISIDNCQIDDLNPHYIITKEELLSHLN